MTTVNSFEFTFTRNYPDFPTRSLSVENEAIPQENDTRTIAIIGLGKREEVLISKARGSGLDGQPKNFDSNEESQGTFFKTKSFPIQTDSYKVYRSLFSKRELIKNEEYYLDETNGYLVLFHPLQEGEKLSIEYVSESDLNFARSFSSNEIDKIIEIYGSANVQNSITLASQIAFLNDAERVVTVQADNSGADPFWQKAFQTLIAGQYYFIVPIADSNYNNVLATGLDHVKTLSSTAQRKERVLIAAEKKSVGLTRDNFAIFQNQQRAIFVGTDVATIVASGETNVIDGGFIAAAIAGKLSSLIPIASSLLNKTLLGINIDSNQRFSETTLNEYAKNGATVLQYSKGATKVARAVTTIANNNAVDEEISILRIRDLLAFEVRKEMENTFVGRVITKEILMQMEKNIISFLKGQIAKQIIADVANVSVKQDAIEPRQVNIVFDVIPLYPLNKIVPTIRTTTISTL